jgi:peroxiredoxin
MRLEKGSRAPDCGATSLRGESIRLSAEWSQGPLWLAFFRFAACPLCNLRVHEMIEQWSRFDGKLRLIAVFQSPASRLEEFVATQDPPFTLIADPEMALYAEYAVEVSFMKALSAQVARRTVQAKRKGFRVIPPMDGPTFRVPADFLIERGFVKVAHYGKNLSDHIPFETVERFLGSPAS